MPLDLTAEARAAEALLRQRLDPDLVQLFDADGDFAEALLRYLQRRRAPNLLFDLDNLATIAATAREHDPEEAAWELEIADNACEGRLYGASNPYCRRFLELDREGFDFTTHPHPDPQTIHGLNRQRWMRALGQTYWLDQDERRFEAMMREWDYFIEKVPWPDEAFLVGTHAIGPRGYAPPYGELDLFIRLTNWYWAYWLMLCAAEMTAQRNLILLARCLRHFDLVAARGIATHHHNFTSMQLEALYVWASALPEIQGMTVWKHSARNSMEGSLCWAVYADGVQWERSTGYHAGCIRWYGTSYLLGQRMGEPWSEEYGRQLRRMGQVLDAMITPDRKLALVSDSDRVRGWEAPLGLLYATFPELRFQHAVTPSWHSCWATNGRTWDEADTQGSVRHAETFPHGGFGILRSSVATDAQQLLLDNGATNAGHCHKANLCIQWDALGHPLLVDPGRWIYDQSAARAWVVHGESHNTILPLKRWMEPDEHIRHDYAIPAIPAPGDPRLGAIEVDEQEDQLIVRSSLAAYGIDTGARVTRTVIMGRADAHPWLVVHDRFAGSTPHLWTTSWLIPASQPMEGVDGGRRAALDRGPRLAMTWLASEPMEIREDARFWCPNYAEREPARWLRCGCQSSSGDRTFAFYAQPDSAPPIRLEREDGSLRLVLPHARIELRLDDA